MTGMIVGDVKGDTMAEGWKAKLERLKAGPSGVELTVPRFLAKE